MNNDKEYLDHLRHSAAHLLAAAVMELYPQTKRTIGPAIDNGFYYDFDFGDVRISEEDFPKIEAKMKEILKSWNSFEKQEVTKEQALEEYKDNEYKVELINEFASEGQSLTFYKSGNYTDLCRGGHVENPSKEIGAFKLLSVAGAYWRGSEANKMLTRIYATAFNAKAELDEYLVALEEAKKRDHRKLNEVLDIFAFSDLVGKGLVMFTPNGTIIKNLLREHLMDICKEYGAMEVNIPHMAKIDLYEKSGHAKKFREELFYVKGHYDNEYVLKPVNCPHHTQIYASRPRSYKDLPIAYVESTQQHRDEKPGSMGGLNRTSSFEVDDGHTFCRPDQIKEEALKIVKIIEEFYKAFGMWGNHWVSLSFRDPETPEKYIGSEEDWNTAQSMLSKINEELGLNGQIRLGEAALYGPKIDFMLKDALGNDRQLGTVQIDFAMPKNFGLEYADSDGTQKTPVMLHRAILGSYQRFIAYLMESTMGAFPVWLSPTQVTAIPISSENHLEYTENLVKTLRKKGLRIKIDAANETLGNRIRKAQAEKIPFMIVIGEKEIESGNLSIRKRTGDSLNMSIDEFVSYVEEKVSTKSLEI